MKTDGNILSLHIDIPKSELSIFEYLAQKMGWKIHSRAQETEKSTDFQQEDKLFFENSKRSMSKHIEKYL